MADDPQATTDRGQLRSWLLGFARGSVIGGAIFTWEVAPSHQMVAIIGVMATILGAFCQEVLS